MKKKPGIKVFAPATVANVACGFDVLGFAIDKPGDELIVNFNDTKESRIIKITGDKGRLPREMKKNTAGVSVLKFLEHLEYDGPGFDIEIHKKMPFGSGLGSSSASAVASVFAVNDLLKQPLSKRELLPFAVEGEAIASGAYHADNVAPSLLGGIILIRDNDTLDISRIPCPGLYATVVYPHISIMTKDARNILSDKVDFKNSIKQGANLASFVVGCYTSNIPLISRTLEDLIIEPQRSHLIPFFKEIKESAYKNGAMGCSISGAGPSIFALSKNSFIAENIREEFEKIYSDNKIKCTTYASPINLEGVYKH